jgi:D,D-heptose 1,7-bisphosphate phosphatase
MSPKACALGIYLRVRCGISFPSLRFAGEIGASLMKNNIAVFLDRDGTINEEVGYLDRLDKLKIIPNAYEAIRLINLSGMKAIVISNQAGVARGFFTEEFVRTVNKHLQADLKKKNAVIDGFYYCPHHPTEGKGIYLQNCNCRKPAAGMLLQAAQDLDIDLSVSYFIGDRFIDMETAKKVGVKGVLVKTGYGEDLLQDDGPDAATAENKPTYIAADILDAVRWILKDEQSNSGL